ncbi:hypothetical protein CK223_29860 [Mesorhizobium loti]|nr:hypothetical protein CK223_29860 [Mesorhizobium loti]
MRLSTPPREGRLDLALMVAADRPVSIHARGMGDDKRCGRLLDGHVFRSTPSERGDKQVSVALSDDAVSIHAPVRGATAAKVMTKKMQAFRSSPRERATERTERLAFLQEVSTHVPATGATREVVNAGDFEPFRSTPPARGATEFDHTHVNEEVFRSTPRERGATDRPAMARHAGEVSIHALARRATPHRRPHRLQDGSFDPRPRERATVTHAQRAFDQQFRSTPREKDDARPGWGVWGNESI